MYRQPRSGFTRIPFVQECEVEVDGQARAGLICNVSVLGVYLQMEPLPAVGTELTLRFYFPEEGLPVTAVGTVTWVNDRVPEDPDKLPQGCGVRFRRLEPSDVRRISDVVASFRADPRPMISRIEPRIEKSRIPFVAHCVVSGASGTTTGSVCNLSTEGVFVTLQKVPPVGEAVIVKFRIPGREEAFERAAKVAWVNREGPDRVRVLPPGCGLRFVNLSRADRSLLIDLVDRYAGLLVEARQPAVGEGTGES